MMDEERRGLLFLVITQGYDNLPDDATVEDMSEYLHICCMLSSCRPRIPDSYMPEKLVGEYVLNDAIINIYDLQQRKIVCEKCGCKPYRQGAPHGISPKYYQEENDN